MFLLFTIFIGYGYSQSVKSVSPLLTTGWAQTCYYNDSCPEDINGSCGHTRTGCGATAMAQILKYYNYPVNGDGFHSYTDPEYGEISADFENTFYNWVQMPNYLNSSNSTDEVAAVAQLMLHCGVAVEMDYGASSSSSGTTAIRNSFPDFFRYSSKAQLIRNSHFPDSTWKNILKNELDNGRPVFYGITSGTGGHFIVLDGYTCDDYFHFNWGYGTGYNKKLTELPPIQEAVIGIEPIPEVTNLSAKFIARFNRFDDGSGTGEYQNNRTIQYLIAPPGADSIALFFSRFSTQSGYDYFRIYDGDTTGGPLLGEYCGFNLPPHLVSSSGKILIEFSTDSTTVCKGWEVGYSAYITGAVSGLKIITDSIGAFDDGSGTAYYQSHTDAYWLISPPGASSVTLSFNSFNTEFSCDYLWVFDGDNISSCNLLGVFSGTSLPPDLTALSGKMLLHFNSDFSTTRPGWNVSFTSEFEKKELELKVFLEGPFRDSVMTTDLAEKSILPLSQPFNRHPWNYYGDESVSAIPVEAVDWVLVELCDTTGAPLATQETMIERLAAFLLNDGSIAGMDGFSAPTFNHSVTHSLFVVIRHRNHLSIMSANPLTEINNSYSYDFSSGIDKVFGGNVAYRQLSPEIWGMVVGDANSDGAVDSADILIWRPQAGESGYFQADFNFDSQIENRDKDDYWLNNSGMESQIPQ